MACYTSRGQSKLRAYIAVGRLMVKGEEGRRGIPKSGGGNVVQNKSSQEKNQVNEPFFFVDNTRREKGVY